VRRYTPTWAVVVAVVGFLPFFVGLLALVVRNTETLDIRVTANPAGSGSVMVVNGVADTEIITRLQAMIMSGQPV
jgi:hypothetical protein